MTMPDVLGLHADEAVKRLTENGFANVEVLESGRRREGRPRVIRQNQFNGKVELIVSYFKELKIPPVADATSPLGSAPAAPTREGREL